jgi:hypothetical protein
VILSVGPACFFFCNSNLEPPSIERFSPSGRIGSVVTKFWPGEPLYCDRVEGKATFAFQSGSGFGKRAGSLNSLLSYTLLDGPLSTLPFYYGMRCVRRESVALMEREPTTRGIPWGSLRHVGPTTQRIAPPSIRIVSTLPHRQFSVSLTVVGRVQFVKHGVFSTGDTSVMSLFDQTNHTVSHASSPRCRASNG